MKAPDGILLDFETKGIDYRPDYPPKPVSLALEWPGQRPLLMAWGHGDGSKAAGNNCTEAEARGELRKAYQSRYPLIGQNMMFDLDVAEEHWELPLPNPDRYHDTMFLIFLDNPHAESIGLKQSAERLLGMPAEEQDRMHEWIIANVPEAAKKPSSASRYICECPYQIVKPYHKGDLVRTKGIFKLLYPRIVDAGMREAYERELKLMPILLRNAREGMRVDMEGMARDVVAMRRGIERAEDWLRKRLKAPGLNLNSPAQLAKALLSADVVREFKLTAKGQPSTSKKSLTIDKFSDPKVYQALQYHGQMGTSVGTFIESWMELGQKTGRIYPNWSQVRVPKGVGDDSNGARSGRIIGSRPNFLNIPKKWKKAVVTGYRHPAFIKGIPELPFVRRYCLPDAGQLWARRDFNQQELRLYGHFEEGPVMEGFNTDPNYDIHELVRAEAEEQLIAAMLREEFDRDSAKTAVFGRIYGQGLAGLMESLRLDESEKAVGQTIRKALNTAVPSIKEMDEALKELAKAGMPLRTWGGRLYYCEEPKYVAKFGRNMTFEYKMLNYLIQPSGADVTKEVLVRFDQHPKKVGRLTVTVYDEINLSTPNQKSLRQDMIALRDTMLSIETDVKMLSDGESGENWGTLTKYPI
jgi:DNA polymerase I-like protein with 3'-5' exonuclease and polymerase domains